MKPSPSFYLVLASLCGTACSSKDETVISKPALAPQTQEPAPAPPPPPPAAAFDANDRERTYRWIADEATAFRLKYLPAKEAIARNPLNDDLQKEFESSKLPAYKSKLRQIVGRDVMWKVKVHSIDLKGVIVEADER
ncbi:hypothetical protein SAMN05444166_2422 [Singulisphaera sp. GP187]|uniref:hypothetical protein n=1 Tax=Singulisphaera sp. GP187 TaxID=1882752 RepID=UPI000928594F|nr:hypothetical protein [Singulisphaera sp. GP187]SIO09615.1 hypothetical protein SAMN05444166_2422 [Singulisphaera sp. GP187]